MQDETSWKSKEAADHYVRVADALIPRRGEILSTISSLATALTPNSPRVLDLGCGNGDVTAAILEEAPEASVLMSDFSGEMVRLSSERFADNPRVAVVEHDLDDGLPPDTPDGTFHAVVSCFSLHHVEHGNRVGLYQEVRRVLRSEGVFVNGDRFTGDAHRVSTWEFDNWIKFMAEQIKVVFGVSVPPTHLSSQRNL